MRKWDNKIGVYNITSKPQNVTETLKKFNTILGQSYEFYGPLKAWLVLITTGWNISNNRFQKFIY